MIDLSQHRKGLIWKTFNGGLEPPGKTRYSFSVEQKDAEGIVVVVVIAEEAAGAQADRHRVPSLQVEGHHAGAAVLLILLVPLTLL